MVWMGCQKGVTIMTDKEKLEKLFKEFGIGCEKELSKRDKEYYDAIICMSREKKIDGYTGFFCRVPF